MTMLKWLAVVANEFRGSVPRRARVWVKAEAQTAGYAATLEQLVQASEQNRELNVTIDEKTVKLIVVNPVASTPEPGPEDMP
jgi:hypothetical protein